MKEYEIWIGAHHLGQGYDPSTQPVFIGKETGVDFPAACLKHELKSKLEYLVECETKGAYLDNQSREWFYNPNSNSNSWVGPYFESKEEALKSFK